MPYYDGIFSGGGQQNIRPNEGTLLWPNCVGSSSVRNPNSTQWFDPAAFAIPILGQYGNCGVGIIQGPGLWSVNLGFAKYVSLGTRATLKFEAKMMNAFNHPNLGDPDTDLNSAGVAQIASTNGGTNGLNPSVTTNDGKRHIWASVRVQF